MVYVSTSCLKGTGQTFNENVYRVIDIYIKNGINKIELGASHGPTKLEKLYALQKQHDLKFIIHGPFLTKNRFFWFNLGSQNKKILDESIRIAKETINFCRKTDTSHWGFHAPMIGDIQGEKFVITGNRYEYEDVYQTFKENLQKVLDMADKYDIDIAVETSICKDEAVTFSKPNEFERLFSEIKNKNLGMLMDHGHIRYSGEHLNFNYQDFYKFKDKIKEMHIHYYENGKDHLPLKNADMLKDFDKSMLRKIKLTLESMKLDINQILESKKVISDFIA